MGSEILFLSSGWYIVGRPQFLVHSASLYLPHCFWNQVNREILEKYFGTFSAGPKNNLASIKWSNAISCIFFYFLSLCLWLVVVGSVSPPKGAKGSVRVKKTKKNWPPPKLIFCHKLSPLDWIMVIWAIFGLPGPSGGSGGPMWGLGGPAGIKFTNFHMWLFLALRCHFLDLTSF